MAASGGRLAGPATRHRKAEDMAAQRAWSKRSVASHQQSGLWTASSIASRCSEQNLQDHSHTLWSPHWQHSVHIGQLVVASPQRQESQLRTFFHFFARLCRTARTLPRQGNFRMNVSEKCILSILIARVRFWLCPTVTVYKAWHTPGRLVSLLGS